MQNTTILWIVNIYPKLHELKVSVLGIVLLGGGKFGKLSHGRFLGHEWHDSKRTVGLWAPSMLVLSIPVPLYGHHCSQQRPKAMDSQQQDLIPPFLFAA